MSRVCCLGVKRKGRVFIYLLEISNLILLFQAEIRILLTSRHPFFSNVRVQSFEVHRHGITQVTILFILDIVLSFPGDRVVDCLIGSLAFYRRALCRLGTVKAEKHARKQTNKKHYYHFMLTLFQVKFGKIYATPKTMIFRYLTANYVQRKTVNTFFLQNKSQLNKSDIWLGSFLFFCAFNYLFPGDVYSISPFFLKLRYSPSRH